MIFTDKPCGSISSWIALQVIPGSTLMVRFSGEKATTRFIPRMSRKRLPSVAICPPMLKRPPPIEIGPEWLRTSSRTSSTARSEEHTSELQSHVNLVCRLLLEKKKKKKHTHTSLKKKKNKN